MAFAPITTRGGRVLVEPVSDIAWILHAEVRYIGETDEFIVPEGYVTDFASVPRLAVWLVPRFGDYTKAAILHDFLLTNCVESGRISSVDADNLFRRALRELGVPAYRRNLMWTGVRWAALFSRSRRPGWLRTLPEVLAWTLVFLASIVPPLAMLIVALALVVHGAIEFVTGHLFGEGSDTGSLKT